MQIIYKAWKHLLLRQNLSHAQPMVAFDKLSAWRAQLPIKKIAFLVMAGLLAAGLVEGHLTPLLMAAVTR